MKLVLTVVVLVASLGCWSQLNIDSIGHVDYMSEHLTMLNDVWGYVDEDGNEYGLVGAEKGTSVVDLSTPSNPVEIFWEPGIPSVWRDLKTWGDYAYITTEASSGLLIIDLSPLPSSTALTTSYYNGPANNEWESAHNLFIDSSGYAYIFGANRGNKGVIILDVHTDPMNPIEVGVFDNWYVHDGYVLGDTMYLANLYEGFISMVDVTDKSNPILLGTAGTPSTFSHNVWATENGDYAFTTDEVSAGYIAAFDVTDPFNIVEIDRIQSSPGAGVIPHNTHVLGNHIVTSYYSDGVVVHDVTYPYNMIEVGNYDTYFDQTTDYDGCWGAFPYFPSGLILATDRSEGLFVLSPNYVQASYLEGIITNSITTDPIDDVEVTITGGNQQEYSTSSGFYATGMAAAGVFDVTYFKIGYYSQTISVSINSGIITTQNVQLVPIPPYGITVNVYEDGSLTPINGADVRLEMSLLTVGGQTNALGEENLTLYYEDVYTVSVGKWGYITYCNQLNIDNSTGSIDVFLSTGIYDDFTFDFGWNTSGTATTGLWERGVPNTTSSNSAPGIDSNNDCGDFAYVTGNAVSFDSDFDDVDNGTVSLTSPVIDLTGYIDPYVNYERWFYNFHGPVSPPDDVLEISVSNGLTTVVLEYVDGDTANFFNWHEVSIRLQDYISITSTMQFFFKTSDISPQVNITEAGVDHFFIAEASDLGFDELDYAVLVYPNPVVHELMITGGRPNQVYAIVKPDGGEVLSGCMSGSEEVIDVSFLSEGVYFLRTSSEVFKIIKIR
ncbi:MAG: choice-of-anchor B family protein [Crocinitomicaceae bacterium]|nr:choice-of-anchor B family protein [Crocinitomicaceae bacterium]MDG1776903.1 choice-of-anchor B family protein [Crocinitomicaceae bacterium]